MQDIKKIYVVGVAINYADFIFNHTLVDNISDADIVIFTGGEDVDPSLYGCARHHSTHSNINRDKQELAEFKKIRPDQLVVSVCRGSQLMCVANGGKLIQNVTNHAIRSTHSIFESSSNKLYEITSTHHQMQYPFNLNSNDYTTLFYTTDTYSTIYEGDGIDVPPYEPEIVLYHKKNMPRCLAIQGHPEYMRKESPIIIRLNEIINNLLNEKD